MLHLHLKLIFLFTLLGLGQWSVSAPPNFVLIMADDFTYTDSAVYGGQAATPHMERLAAEGMTFTRTFQSAPMCSPTRHSLYTGLYPVKSGAWPNHTFVKPGVRSIAHYLQDVGYRTGFSGKTHINPLSAFPFEYLSAKVKNSNPDFAAVDKFLTAVTAANQPFSLILTSNEPHTPWNKGDASAYPPDQITLPPLYPDTPATRENFSRYLAEITYFDSQVGEALALLDKHGLIENTVFLLLTEQGNAFPFAKWTCYDKGLGSGMIVRWPGKVRPGSVSDALVEYVDVVPTFLELAAAPLPDNLDGRSLVPLLTGKTYHHKDVVFGLQTSVGINNGPTYYGIRSARDERYRYVRNLTPETTFSNWATATDFWAEWETAAAAGDPVAITAVHRYQVRPAEELYDNAVDPWNRYNLAADPAYDRIKTKLSRALDNWMQAQGDHGATTEEEGHTRLWQSSTETGGVEGIQLPSPAH